ncbi:KpsF/GutQ family sugar-phosphate isomerase [Xanthobacter dioxanivorans]|uniref:KpsF/GutQ family sugar-phosphate isomerase n=1 Tax=Xanthobacter dioxanivorans TaxID=2528964 RepID=A0A974PU16_9HYPH|nr:KpsF/GutQ family sugar-phosphate isomerase [Xanthobacter dioxanivorans]
MRSPANRAKADDGPHIHPASVVSALATLDAEKAGLAALAEAMAGSLGAAFDVAVATIQNSHGRVVVTGMGKSGHVARKIAATLASTGTPAHYVHPAEASHGDLGMITTDDVIVALSWSGETVELRDLVEYSRRFDVPLIAFTSNAESALASSASVVLTLPVAQEACPHGLAPTTSTVMQLALGDALAVALLQSRGFTALDFRQLHPGGKLGASLKFVRDVMRQGDRVPVVPAGTLMGPALVEMSAKGLGCVGVLDEAGGLVGIVTDGDLRRHMANDLTARRVEEIMTPAPRTVRPDQLASEALNILNSRKITALLVVDGTRPVGVLHIHDLLLTGIA